MTRAICHIVGSFCAFGMIFLVVSYGIADTPPWEEILFKSNQSLNEGHFEEAIAGYTRLFLSGHVNGHLLYNLGNAHFRLGHLGQAVLNYERAKALLPRDPDLNFNLKYARDQIVDVIPESRGFVDMAFFWLDAISMHEVFWGFAVLNFLFWGALLVRLVFRVEWAYYGSLVLLILWLIGGVSFGLKWYQSVTDSRAVVIEREVNVLAGPHPRDTLLFKLHEGTIVKCERSEGDWSLIHIEDKKRGWLQTETIERIRPHKAPQFLTSRSLE